MVDIDKIRDAINEAVSVCVLSIQLKGIFDAAVQNAAVASRDLEQVAAQLSQARHYEHFKFCGLTGERLVARF